MSPRWSTARVTAIASALAIGGSVIVATPTLGAPGDADASAVKLQLSLEFGRTILLDVDAAAATEGPPGEVAIPDLSTHLGALTGASVAGTAALTTTSGAEGTSSSALVEDLSVSMFGVAAVEAKQVTSSADCLPGDLPAAETDSQDVTILGTPVDVDAVPAEGQRIATAATVPGMTSAELVASVLPATASQNASSATATGLIVVLSLTGSAPEVGRIATILLGRISIGDVNCEHVDVPDAPTAEELLPADGVSTGGDTVTLRGSGFTADTTVAVGGTEARDVVVLSDSELTFTTPAGPAGPALVTATTASGTTNGLGFSYNEPAPVAPEVEVLDPDETATTGGRDIWVFGSDFVRGRTSVTVGDTVVDADNVEVLNTGALIVEAPAHAAGVAPLSVTTPFGTSGTLDLTYIAVAVPPAITSITPDTGPLEGNTLITLKGTGFLSAATMVTMGPASFLDDDVTVISDTELSFTVEANTAGPVSIFITTPVGVSNEVTFTYAAAAPDPTPTPTPTPDPDPTPAPDGLDGHDFSGDGNVDVLARSADGKLWLYASNGSGGWDARVQIGSGWNGMTSILAPGDFDGDGNPDVLARDGLGKLWLYPGNGDSGWLTKAQVGSGWNPMTSILGPGDFDGDTNVDVLARDRDGRLWLYPGNGSGSWLAKVQVGSGWHTMTSIVGPGDFDGDTNVDVLARDRDGRLWLYPGNGSGGWLKRVQAGSGWHTMNSIVGPGDFDGDGSVDVLSRDRDGRLWLYPGNGSGGWLKRVQAGSGWHGMTSIF